jgi:acyl transferase domain-containing protein
MVNRPNGNINTVNGSGLLANGAPQGVSNTTSGSTEEATEMSDEQNGRHNPAGAFGNSQRWLLVWSASDEKALQRVHRDYSIYCATILPNNRDGLDRLATTLAAHRTMMNWRSYALVKSPLALQDLEPNISVPRCSGSESNIAFVFTGQGAQYAGMGLDLMHYPAFSRILEEIADMLSTLGCSWNIIGKSLPARRCSRHCCPAIDREI